MDQHIVPKGNFSFLNKYAPKIFPLLASKAKAKDAIVKGLLLVNNAKVSYDYKIKPGDKITFKGINNSVSNKKVYEFEVPVVFEDEYMAIVNKPGGIPVNGNQFKTLDNCLPFNLKHSNEEDRLPAPLPLHRLDGPTTGLVVIAKTNRAQVKLGQDFENKKIKKRYKAVAIGKFNTPKGKINKDIQKKPSTSTYEVVNTSKSKKYGFLSLVNLSPITGRTHQLRIHLESIGHPIIGDKQYSGNHDVLNGKGLMLCSDQLTFIHPITKKVHTVEIKIPNKFRKYMERESFMANK